MGDEILELAQIKTAVEAVLFASDKPLTLAQVIQAMDGTERKLVHQVLDELKAEYDSQSRGFRLVEIAEGWQLVSRPQHATFIRRLNRAKMANRLSRPALETLAIIAYKQPITKTEVENIRGVNSDGVMHNLLERRLVRSVGRKDVVGRPLLYGTTREFLQAFGLKDLGELPKLTELKDLLMQEPEAELWDIGPDGKLVAKQPEDFIKTQSDELLQAMDGEGQAEAPGSEEADAGKAKIEDPEDDSDWDDDDSDDEEDDDDEEEDDEDDEDEDDEDDENDEKDGKD